jgi:hypothetical protein
MDADNGGVDHLNGAVIDSANDFTIKAKMPTIRQRTKRLWQVAYGPNSPTDRRMVRLTAISRRCR